MNIDRLIRRIRQSDRLFEDRDPKARHTLARLKARRVPATHDYQITVAGFDRHDRRTRARTATFRDYGDEHAAVYVALNEGRDDGLRSPTLTAVKDLGPTPQCLTAFRECWCSE